MEIGAATYAAGAAATAGGVGIGLFNYNRGNYMMDQKLHYARFNALHTLAIAQTGQYRQDITDLTSLTVGRVHIFADIAAMTATILTALYCPGRLGLHTPPPPGWLMGLFMVNLAGCYIYLGLTIWLGMHASLRADSAAVHMLTRFVRLPVPAQWMLDRARKFLSSFEEQPLKDVLRIPFTRHQYPSKTAEGGYNEGMEVDPDADTRRRHGYDVPAWYRKERAIDHSNTFESMLPYGARGSAPEHFEAFREVQNEWWPYDVYCRLSIFLAFMHLTHCWTYMQIGHQLQETRAIFAAGCVVLSMSVLQQIILTLDIIPKTGEFPLQRIGPFAQFFGYVAACIDYRPTYSQGVANFGYLLVFIAYAIHIVYTLQLLRICAPDTTAPEPAEAPAASWWPGSWRLPSSFQHAVWLVAPPRQLEPGQSDLAGELRAESTGNAAHLAAGWKGITADVSESEKRRDVHRALGRQGESPAWANVRMGLLALVAAWVFLAFGFGIEIINQGTDHPSLLNAPGLPNNLRDPRYRPAKPWHWEPTEVGTGGAAAGPAKLMPEDAVERRLSQLGRARHLAAASRKELASRLRTLLPYLSFVALGGSSNVHNTGPTSLLTMPVAKQVASAAAQPNKVNLRWPAMFEPRLLACAHASAETAGKLALALSHAGRGAVVSAGGQPMPFALEGASGLGMLMAAAWDGHGLLLAAASGAVLECPGSGPTNGRWQCHRLKTAELPMNPTQASQAIVALARRTALKAGEESSLHAAVVHPAELSVMLLARAAVAGAAWLPSGEVRTHAPAASATFTPTAGHLLLSFADGAVARMNLSDGSMAMASAAADGFSNYDWQATCGLPSGRLVQLALGRQASTAIREPSLFLG